MRFGVLPFGVSEPVLQFWRAILVGLSGLSDGMDECSLIVEVADILGLWQGVSVVGVDGFV